MNSIVTTSLDDIIQETKSYQDLIDGEAWEELDKLLKNRQAKLESILSNPIEDQDKDDVIDQLSKVASLDKGYQTQLEKNRKQSTDNVLIFKRKHNAANAYRNIENS